MHKYLIVSVLLVLLIGCNKKSSPAKTNTATNTSSAANTIPAKSDSFVVKKRNFTPKKKDIIPPSIVVNDKAAKKAVDGRLYYDLLGNRYWKNYKNGKYYLFNQKMYDDPAFKPPK